MMAPITILNSLVTKFGASTRSTAVPVRRLPRLLVFCLLPTLCLAQDFTMTASDESALPSEAVATTITIGHPEPARGFSLGVTINGNVLTPVDIEQGAQVLATNGGAGADFFYTDLDPRGGPGAVVGCVISVEEPIEEIAPGILNEVAIFGWVIAGSALPGDITPIDFSSDLGEPAVAVVISVAGDSVIPVTEGGSVKVLTPPVESLQCELTDPCGCEFTLSWTNAAVYQEIRILADGQPIASIPGDADSFLHTLSDPPAVATLDVVAVGTSNTLSVPMSCEADCPGCPQGTPFIRGDANGDALFNGLIDTLFMLNFAFIPGSPAPACLEACDADDDRTFNGLVDSLYTLNFAFVPGSAPIPPPHPACGDDLEPDNNLGCNPNACP